VLFGFARDDIGEDALRYSSAGDQWTLTVFQGTSHARLGVGIKTLQDAVGEGAVSIVSKAATAGGSEAYFLRDACSGAVGIYKGKRVSAQSNVKLSLLTAKAASSTGSHRGLEGRLGGSEDGQILGVVAGAYSGSDLNVIRFLLSERARKSSSNRKRVAEDCERKGEKQSKDTGGDGHFV